MLKKLCGGVLACYKQTIVRTLLCLSFSEHTQVWFLLSGHRKSWDVGKYHSPFMLSDTYVLTGWRASKQALAFLLHLPNKFANSYRRPQKISFSEYRSLHIVQMLHFEKQFPLHSSVPVGSSSPAKWHNVAPGQCYIALTLSIGPLNYETAPWPFGDVTARLSHVLCVCLTSPVPHTLALCFFPALLWHDQHWRKPCSVVGVPPMR